LYTQVEVSSADDVNSEVWSSIHVVLIVVFVGVLIVTLLTLLSPTYYHQPTVISTTLGYLLSTNRRRRDLTFGPPVHRPCYPTEHSWAEWVLTALRDRRDAETATDAAITGCQFIYINDSPDFQYSS